MFSFIFLLFCIILLLQNNILFTQATPSKTSILSRGINGIIQYSHSFSNGCDLIVSDYDIGCTLQDSTTSWSMSLPNPIKGFAPSLHGNLSGYFLIQKDGDWILSEIRPKVGQISSQLLSIDNTNTSYSKLFPSKDGPIVLIDSTLSFIEESTGNVLKTHTLNNEILSYFDKIFVLPSSRLAYYKINIEIEEGDDKKIPSISFYDLLTNSLLYTQNLSDFSSISFDLLDSKIQSNPSLSNTNSFLLSLFINKEEGTSIFLEFKEENNNINFINSSLQLLPTPTDSTSSSFFLPLVSSKLSNTYYSIHFSNEEEDKKKTQEKLAFKNYKTSSQYKMIEISLPLGYLLPYMGNPHINIFTGDSEGLFISFEGGLNLLYSLKTGELINQNHQVASFLNSALILSPPSLTSATKSKHQKKEKDIVNKEIVLNLFKSFLPSSLTSSPSTSSQSKRNFEYDPQSLHQHGSFFISLSYHFNKNSINKTLENLILSFYFIDLENDFINLPSTFPSSSPYLSSSIGTLYVPEFPHWVQKEFEGDSLLSIKLLPYGDKTSSLFLNVFEFESNKVLVIKNDLKQLINNKNQNILPTSSYEIISPSSSFKLFSIVPHRSRLVELGNDFITGLDFIFESTEKDSRQTYVLTYSEHKVKINNNEYVHIIDKEEGEFDSYLLSTTPISSSPIQIYTKEKDLTSSYTVSSALPAASLKFNKDQEKIVDVNYYGSKINNNYKKLNVLGDQNILLNYYNPNLMVIITQSKLTESASNSLLPNSTLWVNLVDVVTGSILHRLSHENASGPVSSLILEAEGILLVSYFNIKAKRSEISSIFLFDSVINTYDFKYLKNKRNQAISVPVTHGGSIEGMPSIHELEETNEVESIDYKSSYTPSSTLLKQKTYISPSIISGLSSTVTRRGINNKKVLLSLTNGQIVGIDWRILHPRRPESDPTQFEKEEGLMKYHPMLLFAPTSYLSNNFLLSSTIPSTFLSFFNNYFEINKEEENQITSTSSSFNVFSAPAILESESLIISYGMNSKLFMTKIMPSTGFDILGEDFNHFMLLLLLGGLTFLAVFLKRWSQKDNLSRLWA